MRMRLLPAVSKVVLVAMFGSTMHAVDEPFFEEASSDKYLVLDRRVIEYAENARLVLGVPEKEPRNPLMRSDQPWENATNNYYPNVIWNSERQEWSLWYKDVLAEKEVIAKMDAPSTVHDVGWYLLYATSKDGLEWTRPKLDLHKFDGRTGNNIVARDCPNVGVFRDERDPDWTRRYKMVYDVGLGKPRVRFSPDGVIWGEPFEPKGFSAQQGDTHNNAFYDRRLRKYLWFTKLYLGERLVTRLESDDFMTWKSSGVVLRSTVEEGRDSQTYALTVFPYANIWLGYVMMYHVASGRTVDVELAWSPDSIHWERVAPGTPFLKLGAPGSYDSGCIYAQAGSPRLQDGKMLIYYGGSPTVHLGWKRSADLCLARLRPDGFAGYEAEDPAKPAVLTTSLFKSAAGKSLSVIADGEVKMDAVLDGERTIHLKLNAEGRVGGDWMSDRPFRLKMTLAPGAKVYGINGVVMVNTAMPVPKLTPLPRTTSRPEPVVVSFNQDAQGWKGVDAIEHHAEGYVTISRAKNLRPIAQGTPLPGDWSSLLGGDEATIAARVRAPKAGGAVRLEVFARDVAQWSFEKLPPFSTDWQTVSATIRYDWTDEQAKAAGWVPSAQGFSWRETIQHAGRVVIVAAQTGAQESFDLDEVRLQGR